MSTLFRSVTAGSPEFDAALERLARRGESDLDRVEAVVRDVVTAVRTEGDAALARYVEKFEKRRPERFFTRDYGGRAALESLPGPIRAALELGATRIRRYHEEQRDRLGGFEYSEDGVTLASRVTPLERVGVYAPGGKALYPSSVLMCAIPAREAGVARLALAAPPGPDGRLNQATLAAAELCGVDEVYAMGGAQAIFALAHGTETVAPVDVIAGPGNSWVQEAKRSVYGRVGIDS